MNKLAVLESSQVLHFELPPQLNALRQQQAELKASRDLYFELYDEAPVGYCTLTEEGLVLQTNLTLNLLLDRVRKDLLKQPLHRFIIREDRQNYWQHLQEVFATGEPRNCDVRMEKKDGTVFWVCLRSIKAHAGQGISHCRTAFTDVTESKRVEEALRQQKEFFHEIAENLSDFIAVLDLDGRRIYNSPSYERFFGPTRDLQNTESFAEIHPDDYERVKQVFQETVQTGQGHQIDYRFVTADGSIRDMESRGSVLTDRDGRVNRVLVVARDVTERKQLQDQVRHLAFHDALTGLPNRSLFNDRLHQAMAEGARSSKYGALMFLDLDNFKPINDSYGHEVGDLLLIEVADRLKRCVREVDTVARFGGDEFVVLLSKLDATKANSLTFAGAVAEKLRITLLRPYALRFTGEDNVETAIEHRCTASIGVALFKDHETNAGSVMKRADAAMYLAKHGGGNKTRFL